MSELTLTVLQLGFLVLLWLFVLGVVGVLRGDLYGTRVAVRQPPKPKKAAPSPRPAGAPVGARQPPAPKGPPVPRQLVVTEGGLQGTTITLGTSTITIGRAPECTLVVDDEYASGRHARIYPHNGSWFLEDLGSTNGTYLRKEQVQAPVQLALRTPVRIGRTVLELRD